jgi:hypothetical protein
MRNIVGPPAGSTAPTPFVGQRFPIGRAWARRGRYAGEMDATCGCGRAIQRVHRAAAGLAAALALAGAVDAAAATPYPGSEPGAFCTRPGCTDRQDYGRSAFAGFALATLASVGLGRRRASRHGSPPA